MTAVSYDVGLVEPTDGYLHAVQKRISGRYALCGAGRIDLSVSGEFDPQDPRSCPRCQAVTAGIAEPASSGHDTPPAASG